MRPEESKEKQPTEMIVISKSEYDLLRERNSSMHNVDEFELVDLILIPVKHWMIVLAIILSGIILGFYFGTSAGEVSTTSSVIQSGTFINVAADNDKNTNEIIYLLRPESVESMFLSEEVIALMKESLGAVRYSIGYNDKKKESSLSFYKDEASGSSSFANINLQVKILNEKLGILKLNVDGEIDSETLSMLNDAFIAAIMRRQDQLLLDFNKRIKDYENELMNYNTSSLASGSNEEILKRKIFIETLLFKMSQFPSKPTMILQKSPPVTSWSKTSFILPIFTFGFLSILVAFILEFLQNSNFKEKLYNNLNNK